MTLKEMGNYNIMPCLVSRKGNEEYLKGKVYREFLDLCVVYKAKKDQEGYVTINEDMLEGVSEDDLFNAMMKKIKKNPACAMLGDILGIGDDGIGAEVVLSGGRNEPFGAAILLDADFWKRKAEERGEDLFILPCSVHELIVLPYSDDPELAKYYKRTILAVNNDSGAVEPQDKLSDTLYAYRRSDACVSIVE